MKFGIDDLRTDRQSRAAIGLDRVRFDKLSSEFKKTYLELYGTNLKDRRMV